MKKFSKIFAVLMTVCLLFGVVASFGTSAKVATDHHSLQVKYDVRHNVVKTSETTGTRTVNHTSDPVNHANQNVFVGSWDHSTIGSLAGATLTAGGVSYDYKDNITTTTVINATHGYSHPTVTRSGAGNNYPVKPIHEYNSTTGEGYLVFRKDPNAPFLSTAVESSSNNKPGTIEARVQLTKSSSYGNLAKVAYAVVDFDYGTDRWAYTVEEGGKLVWKTGTVIPDGATNVSPAYATGSMFVRVGGANAATLVVNKDEGGYYVTYTKKVSGVYVEQEKTYLSNQPGVLDHFTYIIEPVKNGDAIASFSVHAFINGDYIYTASVNKQSGRPEYIQLPLADLANADDVVTDTKARDNDRYSVVVDNSIVNYYRNDNVTSPFTSGSITWDQSYNYVYATTANGEYGLDQFMSNNVYKTTNLNACPDTLYGIYESRDNSVVVIDDTKYKVLGTSVDLGGIITNGADVTLPAGKAFTASPAADVESFNVTLGDGATLATTAGAYKAVESDGTYALTKIATKANVSLFTDMAFNLYVPADAGFTADGFVDTTVGGVAYKQYTWNPALGSFDSASVTLNYGSVSSVIELDVVKYATLVADEFDCNSVEAKLAYEIMDYKAAVAKYLDPEFDASKVASLEAFYALYAEHADCNCVSAAEIDNAAINKGILEGKTISFLLVSDKFSIVLGGFTAGESVTAAIGVGEGAYNATLTANADGEVVFNDVNAALLRYTFSVTTTAGAGEYRLSAYIAALSDGANKDLAVAMYEYSVAVYNFKTAPIN